MLNITVIIIILRLTQSMNAGSCDNVVNNELMVERNNLSLKISQLQESNEKLSGENEEVKRKLQEVTGQLESSQAALQVEHPSFKTTFKYRFPLNIFCYLNIIYS